MAANVRVTVLGHRVFAGQRVLRFRLTNLTVGPRAGDEVLGTLGVPPSDNRAAVIAALRAYVIALANDAGWNDAAGGASPVAEGETLDVAVP